MKIPILAPRNRKGKLGLPFLSPKRYLVLLKISSVLRLCFIFVGLTKIVLKKHNLGSLSKSHVILSFDQQFGQWVFELEKIPMGLQWFAKFG